VIAVAIVVLIQSVVTYNRVRDLNEQLKLETQAKKTQDSQQVHAEGDNGDDDDDDDDDDTDDEDDETSLLKDAEKQVASGSPPQQAPMLALAAMPPMPVAAGISLIQRTHLFELSESTLRERIGAYRVCFFKTKS
jgi:hypothetical protein